MYRSAKAKDHSVKFSVITIDIFKPRTVLLQELNSGLNSGLTVPCHIGKEPYVTSERLFPSSVSHQLQRLHGSAPKLATQSVRGRTFRQRRTSRARDTIKGRGCTGPVPANTSYVGMVIQSHQRCQLLREAKKLLGSRVSANNRVV